MNRDITTLHPFIQKTYSRLSSEQKVFFWNEFEKKQKSVLLGYLWLAFGTHYAYLGLWERQVLYWLTGGGLFIWFIIDLFRIPILIKETNDDIATKVLIPMKPTR